MEYYVLISDPSFLPDLVSVSEVKKCNAVFAKWVVDHDYGSFVDEDGLPTFPPWDLPFAEAEVVVEPTPKKKPKPKKSKMPEKGFYDD